jgi:transcriptional regulator with XRE-family HTH domain
MTKLDGPQIGQRLRIVRLAVGVTEQEAADAAGTTLRTWRKYEINGTLRTGPLLAFADKYDISLDWLIDGDGGAVRSHLAKHAKGKVAILPAVGPRELKARATFAALGLDRDDWNRGA